MDTTETYIKMADCPGIQGRHRVTLGDWYKDRNRDDSVDICADDQWYSADLQAQLIWLPRQDQLQEMVRHHRRCDIPYWLLLDFSDWVRSCDWRLQNLGTDPALVSMEQLWLAFVMKEKHQKVWDGAQWAGLPVEVAK